MDRLIPSLPDELSAKIIKHALMPGAGLPVRWHVQPTRRDLDPDHRTGSWPDGWLEQRIVWRSVGRVSRGWRAEGQRWCGGKVGLGTWRGRDEGWGRSLNGVRCLAIGCEGVCPYKVDRLLLSKSTTPLPLLTHLTVSAPPDLSCLVPLLSSSPALLSLSLLLSVHDHPDRRFCHNVPLPSPARGLDRRRLERFELVVDSCSVPPLSSILELLGPGSRSSLTHLALSFKHVHGSEYAKISFDRLVVELISRHAGSVEEVVVDDWDQFTGYALLSRVSTLPELPELKRLVLGGAGLDPKALGRLECPKLESLEVDDLRRSFRDQGALVAALSGKERARLKRVHCAGDALESRRDEISHWGRTNGVVVEWGHHV